MKRAKALVHRPFRTSMNACYIIFGFNQSEASSTCHHCFPAAGNIALIDVIKISLTSSGPFPLPLSMLLCARIDATIICATELRMTSYTLSISHNKVGLYTPKNVPPICLVLLGRPCNLQHLVGQHESHLWGLRMAVSW
jgi:hypothetical protein